MAWPGKIVFSPNPSAFLKPRQKKPANHMGENIKPHPDKADLCQAYSRQQAAWKAACFGKYGRY